MTLLLLVAGCGQPLHMQYDFGRASLAAQRTQADLTRPSVAGAQYELTGTEAEKVRLNVETAATEEKSGKKEDVQ